MSFLTAVFALAAALLVYAGAVKAVERDAPLTSRALGAAEVVVGALALVFGGPVLAAVVALLYAAFAGYVVLSIRRGATSCGCFGVAEETPPSRRHVAIDGALAVGAAAAALAATSAPIDVAAATPFNGVVYAVFLLTATGMTSAALTT
jgi:hypothetical protein